jgi:hypothetical protein
VEDERINCYGCNKEFHWKCENINKLSASFFKIVKRNEMVKWYCEQCDGFLNSFIQKINSLTEIMKENMNVSKTRPSYAEIARKKVASKEPVVVIKPKNKLQSSEKTRKFVKSIIDPVSTPVSGLVKSYEGGVILKCKDVETIKVIEDKFVEDENYEVKIPEKKLTKKLSI